MGARRLRVRAAGPMTTVQDLGRFGLQRFGVTPAGPMDRLAHAAANALVGNPPDAAALELTLSGGAFAAEGEPLVCAVTGGAFRITLDGAPVPAWSSFLLEPGRELLVGSAPDALRGVLAVAGGIATPPELGSRATHVRTGIGGHQGRALVDGDALPIGDGAGAPGLALDPADLPRPPDRLRVVLGPQDDHFTAEAIALFLEATWRVGVQSDRMGYRLEGPELTHRAGADIVSDGAPLGGIQVPGAGRPIVLMADHQSTGGYPKIACLIGPDLRLLAQRRPGDAVRFQAVSPEAAARAARADAALLAGLAARLRPSRAAPELTAERLLALNLVSGVVGPFDSGEEA